MQVSSYQQAILDAINTTNNNISISGVAGCGKTYTLELICRELASRENAPSILYLAFNNAIVKESEGKLAPYGVTVKTSHSYAKSAIPYQCRVNGYKYQNKVKKDLDRAFEQEHKLLFGFLSANQIVKIFDLIRNWFKPITEENVLVALEHTGTDVDIEWIEDYLLPLVVYLKNLSKWGFENINEIDFVDMLTFPIKFKFPLKHYDVILVDESQDLSPLMHALLKSRVDKSRIINVGDPYQSINAFAGADPDSFYNMQKLTSAIELPLDVCYRCPDPVIELAQKYVPHIQGTGKEGNVSSISFGEMIDNVQLKNLIICRNNFPLVKIAFALMRKGKRAVIAGKKFAEYIESYVKKVNRVCSDFDKFEEFFCDYMDNRINEAKTDDRKEILLDIKLCVEELLLIDSVVSYKTLLETIQNLFSDERNTESVLLSSYHRSKGLQNKNVYIYLHRPLPAPSSEPTNTDQERNLAYVAVTRSLENLFMVRPK